MTDRDRMNADLYRAAFGRLGRWPSYNANADVSPVTIERSDAIDAAGALLMMARDYRRQAKSRANGGARNASHRAWLRGAADVYDAAAKRVQRAADDAGA
jgi:hypothetical protein